MERKVEILSTLFRAATPQQDREVTRVAGSPVRYSSYSDDQLSRYSWLETQQQMLNRCQMLPTDPKFSKYLGPLYEAVYQAFIGEISPAEALLKVARS
jgi:maltose-binding protein MalE